MRCAVEQHREQSPDPADEEGGGQQVDVDAFVLHVACAPQQRAREVGSAADRGL
jgi:hypothetical protein